MDDKRQQLVQEIIVKIKRFFRSTHAAGLSFKGHQLNRIHMGLLFYIAKNDGVSMKELAEFLCVTNGAVTQFVDDLVEKKLVVREVDPQDRRGVKVSLSQDTAKELPELKKKYFAMIAPRFSKLTTEELQTLTQLIDKIDSE